MARPKHQTGAGLRDWAPRLRSPRPSLSVVVRRKKTRDEGRRDEVWRELRLGDSLSQDTQHLKAAPAASNPKIPFFGRALALASSLAAATRDGF